MYNLLQTMRVVMIAILLSAPAAAWADWELDSERSSINFVSIKNDSVGEVHGFASVMGFIGKDGNAQLAIDLNSVETQIDIRDTRMREMLFDTAKFPSAQVTATIDPTVLAGVKDGGAATLDLPVTLSLHGVEQTVTASLVVLGESDGHLRVASVRPVIINAADFGLGGGVEALREVAGLEAISLSVPVTLQLRFAPVE